MINFEKNPLKSTKKQYENCKHFFGAKAFAIFAIFLALTFSCKNQTEDFEPPADKTRPALTAIFFDGKTHISFANPNAYEKAEIFSEGKLIAEVENSSSKVYGNYFYFVDENATAQKCYIVKTKNAAGKACEGVATFAFATELPVIEIQTEGAADVLSKEEKIPSEMQIFDRENPLEKATLTIKGRGNSSWDMAKKSYTIKLSEKQKLLGMKKHKSWALIANYADKTLLRNSFAYKMGREIFDALSWSPSTRQTHVFLNGFYIGVFALTESVKIDKNRVDIANIEDCADENSFLDFGYIVEANFRLDEKLNFTTSRGVPFSLKEPDDISNSLWQKIKEQIQKAEDALYAQDFCDENSENYFEKYFDAASFIDWWIVREWSKDVDSPMYTSCFMYFDPADKKFHMGPLWDFDRGWGQYCDTRTTIEGVSEKMFEPSGFWAKLNYAYPNYLARLFESENFLQKVKSRWNEKFFQMQNSLQNVKSEIAVLKTDAELNFTRWEILGIQSNADAPGYESRTTYQSECDYFCDWAASRLSWMNTAVGGM